VQASGLRVTLVVDMPHAVPARPDAGRLFLGGALALLAVLALGIVGASGYTSSTRWVEHALQVQSELHAWNTIVVEVQNDARAYIVTGDRSFADTHAQRSAANRAQVTKLERLVADSPGQSAELRAAAREADGILKHFAKLMAFVAAGQRDQAVEGVRSGEGRQLVEQFRHATARVQAEEQRLLDDRRDEAGARARLALLGAVLLALAACALLALAWRRETIHERRVASLAREARDRLRRLSDLSAALAGARTTAQVAEVVVEHGLRAADGDTCTLYVLNASGDELQLIGQHGLAAEMIEKIRVLSATAGNTEAFASLQEGRSVWAESEADYLRIYPKLAKANVPGPRAKAFWSVPLKAEGRKLGLLGMGFFEQRKFTTDELGFVDTLAYQCAEALLRASRLEAEEEARRWFSTTLRSIGDAVIATDQRGRVTFLNPIAERLTGWQEEAALGQPLDVVFRIISEDTRSPVESPVSKVLREGKVIGLANHTVLLPKTGPEVPIDDSGAPIRNEAGEIVGVVLVFRDVSRDKRLEARNAFLAQVGEALASSLDYENTLATVASLAVPQLADWCAIDLLVPGTTSIKRVAVAHVDPAKVELAQLLGERYPTPEDAPRGVPHVIRSGKPELYTEIPQELVERSARDAEHLRIMRELDLRSAICVPLCTHGRNFGAMSFVYAASERRYNAEDLAFAEDIAARAAMAIENSLALKETAAAHQRERWLREQAERTNRLKDEFLATVSHELRTPLNAILGWTLTLRRDSIDVDTERALSVIERNARAQATLIDDVLDVSRIVSGKLTLRLVPTSVADAARAAVETVTPAAEAKGISIDCEIPTEPTMITADAARLQQVIWNLLSNSVKFTPKDGRVALRVFREDSEVCVTVQDSGEGIRPELLGAIFEPFHQADSSTTRRHGGLGLGLSIVKQLVAAHGGSVRAESEGPGQGSLFTVRLPVRAVAAPGAEPSQIGSASVSYDPVVGIADDARLDGLRVLVVDDEPDARMLVREILRSHGAQVDVAGSAVEARAMFKSTPPDVIVSDIGMPEEDGYSFIRKVRADGARTPAVALTAYASQQDAQRAFVAGFQKHVIKPVEPAKLVSVVANLGGRSL
jgi:PAS domain S-box-containing protein